MNRGVPNRVHVAQAGVSHVVQRPLTPAQPEIFQASGSQAGALLIPQTKMQLEANGHIGVVCIAAPLPRARRHHRGDVVLGQAMFGFLRPVAQSHQRQAHEQERFGRAEQIDVRLVAQARMLDESGPV